MTPRDIVLCDIDHTVSDAFWRDKMIGGPGGWDAYHEAGDKDPPVLPMLDLVRNLRLSPIHYSVFGLTARPEKWRQLTMRWMLRHDCPFDGLIMRPDNCFDPSPKVKIDQVRATWLDYRERVAFLLEDREDVCTVFRAEGILVLQCHISPGIAPSVPFALDNAEGRLPT